MKFLRASQCRIIPIIYLFFSFSSLLYTVYAMMIDGEVEATLADGIQTGRFKFHEKNL